MKAFTSTQWGYTMHSMTARALAKIDIRRKSMQLYGSDIIHAYGGLEKTKKVLLPIELVSCFEAN